MIAILNRMFIILLVSVLVSTSRYGKDMVKPFRHLYSIFPAVPLRYEYKCIIKEYLKYRYSKLVLNKLRDTQNCIRNEPQYAIFVFFTTRLNYKALKVNLCNLIWQITHNYNCLDVGHYDGTGLRKMAMLGMAGHHGDNS